MKCQVCQYDIPAGSTFCTNCGTPVSSGSSPNQGIAPTMLASTPPPSNPYGASSTNYGAEATPPPNPYGAQPPANPYGTPPPANPYGAPPPAAPYGAPPASPYGMPSTPSYDPNLPPGAFGQPYYAQPQKKKGPNGCVIAIIIVVAIFVLVGGGLAVLIGVAANGAKGVVNSFSATATAEATLTSTTGSSSSVPDASQIDATAASIVTNVKTSSQVDSNYKPTHITSVFSSTDTIYITYDLAGKAGYIIEKTYDIVTGDIAIQSQTPHSIGADIVNGDISFEAGSTGAYTTGLYWCNKSDCSDAALAAVVHFTVI